MPPKKRGCPARKGRRSRVTPMSPTPLKWGDGSRPYQVPFALAATALNIRSRARQNWNTGFEECIEKWCKCLLNSHRCPAPNVVGYRLGDLPRPKRVRPDIQPDVAPASFTLVGIQSGKALTSSL